MADATFAAPRGSSPSLKHSLPKRARASRQRSSKASTRNLMPNYIANIANLAQEQGRTETIDPKVLAIVRKCLARADPERNTSRPEAEKAMRLASRMMDQHNIKQADVVRDAVESDASEQVQGSSTVKISRRQGSTVKLVCNEQWVGILARAMETFFDCRSYSTSAWDRLSMKWTFYGLASNTEAAALGFRNTYNLILDWALDRKGSKNSYYLGVGNGLRDIAKEEKSREKQLLMSRERHSLSAVRGEKHDTNDDATESSIKKDKCLWESDMDGDNLSESSDAEAEPTFKEEEEEVIDLTTFPDYGTEEQEHIVGKLLAPKKELDSSQDLSQPVQLDRSESNNSGTKKSSSPSPSSYWQNSMQLELFRKNAQTVADDFLKSTGTKLHKGRKRRYTIRDWDAYDDGVEDSKKVDVRGNRIGERGEA